MLDFLLCLIERGRKEAPLSQPVCALVASSPDGRALERRLRAGRGSARSSYLQIISAVTIPGGYGNPRLPQSPCVLFIRTADPGGYGNPRLPQSPCVLFIRTADPGGYGNPRTALSPCALSAGIACRCRVSGRRGRPAPHGPRPCAAPF